MTIIFKHSIILFFSSFFFLRPVFAQESEKTPFVRTTLEPNFKSSDLYMFFLGTHWRNLWTTSIDIPLLDLKTFDGGLFPYEKGGGMQTKDLALIGKSRRIWKFRSLKKDLSALLPDDLKQTFAADILYDQVSSANPMAPLIASSLLRSAGVYNTGPTLVFMPDTRLLNHFTAEFANQPGTIEIHPEEDSENGITYFGADKISSTYDFLDEIAKDPNNKVDAKLYLKARLMDAFIGDWDRGTEQWRWARIRNDSLKIWAPVPGDRDQAFSKFTGLIPALTEMYFQQLCSFEENYPPVGKLAWSGRAIDRRFLTEITKQEWLEVTNEVISLMTDEVIELSLKSMPSEFYEQAADEIRNKLLARRSKLNEYSEQYYSWVNEYIDIHCSDQDDHVRILRQDENTTTVSVGTAKNETNTAQIYFFRQFDNEITREIRVFLEDGDDSAFVAGKASRSPLIRIVGGGGKDVLSDSSEIISFFSSFLPVRSALKSVMFYDSGDDSQISAFPGTRIDRTPFPEPKNQEERYESIFRQERYDVAISPYYELSSENGLIFGIGPQITVYDFRVQPYDYTVSVIPAYATKSSSLEIDLKARFYGIMPKSFIDARIKKTNMNLQNFFGFGNETSFDKSFEENEFYRTEQEFLMLEGAITTYLLEPIIIRPRLAYIYADTKLRNPALLNGFPGGNMGLNGMNQLRMSLSLIYDSRDNPDNPQNGLFLNFTGNYYPPIFSIKKHFMSLGGEIRGFVKTDFLTETVTGIKISSNMITTNEYPFFQSVFIGGSETLPGYSRERFAGRSGVSGLLESRFLLGNSNLIIPAKFGFHLFAGTGRVYIYGEDSDKWHSSVGSGLWLSFLNRKYTVSLTTAVSPENLTFSLITSMNF